MVCGWLTPKLSVGKGLPALNKYIHILIRRLSDVGIMFNNLSKYNIILASNSPRRRELLGQLGINYTVKTIDGIDESFPDTLHNAAVAEYIANKKADAYLQTMSENDLIITADTIVCVEDEILGKPEDAEDARRMLRKLSGREHDVVTGVVVATNGRKETFSVKTRVRFANLTDVIIAYYIENFKPFDKAGAYGIQEWIGYVGVESINGSFFNVIGLPVQRLCQVLMTF